jgi:glycosyltransferase involved in cell wall biosynthesis
MKIALALIVKGSDSEARLLDRCLENVSPYVDGIFITSTYKDSPNELIGAVGAKYNAVVTPFKWTSDFAEARNFSFSQVPSEYDYIMWCDADDVWRGLETLKEKIEATKKDAYAFWYLYDFDEYNEPIVAHKKTMIVRNDGSAKWEGAIHEDLVPQRQLDIAFIEGIDRMHLTTEERVLDNSIRNAEIAKKAVKNNPSDPRSYWNYANSLVGVAKYKEAAKVFDKFIKSSESEDEVYLAHTRLASVYTSIGNRELALNELYIAMGLKPVYPDAFLQAGALFFDMKNYQKAEEYIIHGIARPPSYKSMIVFNPRDYDYNPLMLLAKTYFAMSRPDKAVEPLEGCLKIYPNHSFVKELLAEMKKESKILQESVVKAQELEKIEDKEELKKQLDALPEDIKTHPAICHIRNKNFVKDTSSGKDLVIYCGMTDHEWNPDLFKTKGFGGSEEAVVHISKKFAEKGYNVTVYNNCGAVEMERDGVKWRPFWSFNVRDKQDVLIIWRHPKLLDYDLNATKVYIDMHDVVPHMEFTEKRLAKIEKMFVKTKFHRSLFPNIPDEKIAVVPNGLNLADFTETPEKDPYLIINTSSPDRSMDILPEIFRRVKEKVPQAKLKWAYGWDIFDQHYSTNKRMQDWKNSVMEQVEKTGIESLGKIPQSEVAKLYLQANLFVYPTEFAEIDCISVKKAQAGGAVPIVTDFGALDESTKYGVKVHSEKDKDTWCRDYQFHFGVEKEEQIQQFVDEIVSRLGKVEDTSEMRDWVKKFSWENVCDAWYNTINKTDAGI